jgi:hypothetical protein
MIRYVHGFLILLAGALFVMIVKLVGSIAQDKWLERRADAGWLPGVVKVTSGSQPGFPRRWRGVMVHVSPGRLDCRRRYLRLWRGSIEVTAFHGRRQPAFRELLRLAETTYYMNVIEVETATATLNWAVPADRVTWAVNGVFGSNAPAGWPGPR